MIKNQDRSQKGLGTIRKRSDQNQVRSKNGHGTIRKKKDGVRH